jgi:hypothetical protein
MTDDERAAELERLKAILAASGRAGPGYARRIEKIRARIAELDA